MTDAQKNDTSAAPEAEKYTIELSKETYTQFSGFALLMKFQSRDEALSWLMDRITSMINSQEFTPATQQAALPQVAAELVQPIVPSTFIFNPDEGDVSFVKSILEDQFKTIG